MSRLPRFYVSDCSQHVIQRGNNRSPTANQFAAQALVGGTVAGLPRYVGGATQPWLTEAYKNFLTSQNNDNCSCKAP